MLEPPRPRSRRARPLADHNLLKWSVHVDLFCVYIYININIYIYRYVIRYIDKNKKRNVYIHGERVMICVYLRYRWGLLRSEFY